MVHGSYIESWRLWKAQSPKTGTVLKGKDPLFAALPPYPLHLEAS
jgi:hypothetical protein